MKSEASKGGCTDYRLSGCPTRGLIGRHFRNATSSLSLQQPRFCLDSFFLADSSPLISASLRSLLLRCCECLFQNLLFVASLTNIYFTSSSQTEALSSLVQHRHRIQAMADQGDAPAAVEHLNIKVTDNNNEVFFKIKRSTQLKKLMDAFCERQGKQSSSVRFLFDGTRVRPEDTPDTVSDTTVGYQPSAMS